MLFRELIEICAEALATDSSDVHLLCVRDGGGKALVATEMHDLSVAGYHIADARIGKEWIGLDVEIKTCLNPSLQDEYEKRLILCALKQGMDYEDKPPLVVYIKESVDIHIEKLSRVIYLNEESVHTLTSSSEGYHWLHVVTADILRFNKIRKNSWKLADYIYNGQRYWGVEDVEEPTWMEYITGPGDLYENPLNLAFQNEVLYLDSPDIYRGENLVYLKDILALIKMGDTWIKLDCLWLAACHSMLPKEIDEEYLLASSIAEQC